MKIWFKIWENTHLLKSETIEDDTEDTRTHKIFHALEEVCLKWDLGKPIWFDANIAEFQRHAPLWQERGGMTWEHRRCWGKILIVGKL